MSSIDSIIASLDEFSVSELLKVIKKTTDIIAKKQKVVNKTAEKTTKKAKKAKDPSAPKGPMNAFMFFLADNRKAIKVSMPEAKTPEVAKEAGRLWKDADEETKAKYEAKAKADKERYESEKSVASESE